jgi:hypothetical protein
MIAPTIGRVVLYVPRLPRPGLALDLDCQHAATVVHVWSDRMVNLSVFDKNGKQFGVTSVALRQPGDPAPLEDHCEWMDYQVKAAAK